MASLRRDGVRLAYADDGVGPNDFVFIHGAGCDRTYFAAQHDHFARGHRALSVDLRGHGESDRPEEPYSMAGWADDVAWLMEQRGIGRAVVVGHSMGGTVALELAAARTDLVRAVVVMDPVPLVIVPPFRDAVTALRDGVATGDREPQRRFIATQMFVPTSDPALASRIVDGMSSGPTHALVATFDAILSSDGAAAARRVALPMLHITPDSPLNDPVTLEIMLPGIRTEHVPGTGHFVMIEAADRVNDLIEGFTADQAV